MLVGLAAAALLPAAIQIELIAREADESGATYGDSRDLDARIEDFASQLATENSQELTQLAAAVRRGLTSDWRKSLRNRETHRRSCSPVNS